MESRTFQFSGFQIKQACRVHSIDKQFVITNVCQNHTNLAFWIETELTPFETADNYTAETTELANNEKFIGEWKHCIKICFLCYNEFRMLKSLKPVKAIIVG